MTNENYYNDSRVCAMRGEGRWWTSINGLKATTVLPSEGPNYGEMVETEMEVDIIFVVCSMCSGKGTTVNPSIDSHGLSREDFEEDPDFAESYFRGEYDIPCPLCLGTRVTPEPTDEKIKLAIALIESEEEEYQATVRAERMMGA